jgi:galactose mutarotase-like enzyme
VSSRAHAARTPFDFRAPHTIGSRINEKNKQLLIAQGYDHNWVLNKTGPTMDGLHLAAHAWDNATGRELTVWTDQPGVQFLQRQLPERDAGGHQRPHLPAERRVHLRDPALPELAEPAELPVHCAAARPGVQLDNHLPVLDLLTGGP